MNPINLFGHTIKSDITSKEYIDSKFISLIRMMKTKLDLNFAQQNFVQKAGDTMEGNLDMGGSKICNVGIPVDRLDVVNKEYVDLEAESPRSFRTQNDSYFKYYRFDSSSHWFN